MNSNLHMALRAPGEARRPEPLPDQTYGVCEKCYRIVWLAQTVERDEKGTIWGRCEGHRS
jgi:hypothetical protein